MARPFAVYIPFWLTRVIMTLLRISINSPVIDYLYPSCPLVIRLVVIISRISLGFRDMSLGQIFFSQCPIAGNRPAEQASVQCKVRFLTGSNWLDPDSILLLCSDYIKARINSLVSPIFESFSACLISPILLCFHRFNPTNQSTTYVVIQTYVK